MADKEIQNLADLRNEYFQSGGMLQKKFGWKENDARIGVFAKCLNAIEPVLFSLIFCKENLSNPMWQARFSKDHKTPPSAEEVQHQVDSYLMYQQYSYAELFFASIESSMRIFDRAIDPEACNQGKANFASISDFLLKRTDTEKYKPLLELFRLIRNTSHNNGIYLPEREGNRSITWKGTEYLFEEGKSVLFVTMPFLIELSKDLREMLVDIVESKNLSNIQEILDPTFPEEWPLRILNTEE